MQHHNTTHIIAIAGRLIHRFVFFSMTFVLDNLHDMMTCPLTTICDDHYVQVWRITLDAQPSAVRPHHLQPNRLIGLLLLELFILEHPDANLSAIEWPRTLCRLLLNLEAALLLPPWPGPTGCFPSEIPLAHDRGDYLCPIQLHTDYCRWLHELDEPHENPLVCVPPVVDKVWLYKAMLQSTNNIVHGCSAPCWSSSPEVAMLTVWLQNNGEHWLGED